MLDAQGCRKQRPERILHFRWFIERQTIVVAEVCRNRTDRPDAIGTAGFEVPDGHQPACTSALILDNFPGRVNLAFLGGSDLKAEA